ncbi:MAG: hypothetical protein KF745_09345 [Phycisphaeraceae bacterium]|nr:hypothetical protein [Phycisphaeraceae bacterium]
MKVKRPKDQARRAEDERLLHEYLAAHNADCPACGYSLRGLEGGRCPECGLGLHLGLVEAVSHNVVWYAVLWGVVWPLLFDGMVVVGWLLALVLGGTVQRDKMIAVAISFLMLAVCGTMLVFLVRTRRRVWPPATRRRVFVVLGVILAIHAFWLLGQAVILPFTPWG